MSRLEQTPLARANAAFRNKDLESAIALYEGTLNQAAEPLKAHIRFNLDLAHRRLGRTSASKTLTPTAVTLEKPDELDEYYFNLIKQGGFFDPNWYLAQYKGKHKITGNPLAHYLTHGVALLTNPSPQFDTGYYINTHQDVVESGIHPFLHYVCQGCKESRSCLPPPPPKYEPKYTVAEPEYLPRLPADVVPVEKAVRVIAFYLPQFHAIPENDKWWGKGFTEWTNVRPATPQFEGHYQPHVPDDFLGYYDLLDCETQAKQVELAQQYGVEGFCFYLYWFTGRRLLEQPVDNYLNNLTLDFPFCVCWANENWSRRWDGLDTELLMEQYYSPEDDIEFIANTAKYLRDPRYIRINGKPLLLVYRPNLFPSMRETAQRWRDWCRTNSIGEIYLTYPQSFECVDPAEYGFDAACEFPPNNSSPPTISPKIEPLVKDFQSIVYDWRIFVDRSETYQAPNYTLFRGVSPSWDNVARKKNKGIIFHNSCPKLFAQWLVNAFIDTTSRFENINERIVFVNAWNEWAEGAHLEPDKRYGYGWLQALRMAHKLSLELNAIRLAILIHAYYEDVFEEILEKVIKINIRGIKLFVTTHVKIASIINAKLINSKIDFHLEIYGNQGRDVLPFLKISKHILDEGYEYIIKLHTKKSLHRGDGDRWRDGIYSELLSEKFIKIAIATMKLSDSIGMVSPTDQIVPMGYYWGSNAERVLDLSRRIGISKDIVEGLNFVAGTMFIIRKQVVSYLLDMRFSDEDFEVEAGQVDGTLAHAIERFIAVVNHKLGYKLIQLGQNMANLNFEYAARG